MGHLRKSTYTTIIGLPVRNGSIYLRYCIFLQFGPIMVASNVSYDERIKRDSRLYFEIVENKQRKSWSQRVKK